MGTRPPSLPEGWTRSSAAPRHFGVVELGAVTLQKRMLQKGVINFEGVILRRSHIRVENMANDEMAKDEFLEIVRKIENTHGAFVLYSHEYEHLRDDVRQYFDRSIRWLYEELNMVSERP